MSDRHSIEAAFEKQIKWCRELGSPFTADLLADLLDDLRGGGGTAALLSGWEGDPDLAALPLRVAGGLHALALAQPDGELAAVYPPASAVYDRRTGEAVRAALLEEAPFLGRMLGSAPQTNEVRRSIVLLGGFLEASRRLGLPLRLLELGASAGLNLSWPRFRYETASWSWGPSDSSLLLDCDWRGAAPPIEQRPQVLSAAGCDLAPADLEDPAQRLRLEAYVWADQRERLERMRRAVRIAREAGVRVERASADAWLADRLAEPAPGSLTLVYHSVFRQYLPAAVDARLEATLRAAAERATADAPFGHLRYERDGEGHSLRLALWPEGSDRLLARADPHARWVEWLG